MKKQILVTTSWDDGHILDVKLAALLQRYGIRGTFYIAPKHREFSKANLLSKHDINEIGKFFEIGAHTMTHPHLTKIPNVMAAREINQSKHFLEQTVGNHIDSFCYPYGAYNDKIASLVATSGFRIARTTKRTVFFSTNNPYALPTTVHAYTHRQDLFNISLLLRYKTITWDALAKRQFDIIAETGGVYHLWGHSWEIEKFNGWNRLENVLYYIANHRHAAHITNADLPL